MEQSEEKMPWLLFLGVALALALGSFDGAAVQGIFPYLAGGVATSSDHALWALTYFIVNWSVGITLMPWTSARFGARRVFFGACLLAALGSVISAATSNLWILLLSRAMEGMAAGLLVPLSQSLFLRASPPKQHGLVTVLWSNAMLVPFFVGPALGGYLAVTLSYRWIFALSVPIWLFAAWLGSGQIREERGPRPPAFDLAGFLLLYAGLMALQIVLDNGEQYGWWHSRFILSASLIAIGLLSLFAWREASAQHPLLRFHYLRQRNYWLGLVLLCLGWALFMGWASLLPLWAEQNLGFNGWWGSSILIPIGLAAVPVSTLMDRLRGLFGLRRLASACFLLFALAYGTAYLSPMMSLGDLFWPVFLLGLGVGSLFVPLTLIILSGIPKEETPLASTTSNFIRVFSANIGVSMLEVFWARGTALAQAHLRADLRPVSGLPLPMLRQHMEILAATLSLNNLLRLSMWIALMAAVIAYVFLISPRKMAATAAASYVEEEERETASA
ncbi:DHA2 family efflux MFS transporter permease subunit [Acidithiobacillus sp. IBUN Pt1247-S3]|uniref:DHA2 family efflux MFS transporter permease subunit n=1 Tax=Acidithiobacillus sp. IBUN Pt1247-S3 TaxID=3166642 RepID=UPI0034E53307